MTAVLYSYPYKSTSIEEGETLRTVVFDEKESLKK